MMQPPDEDIAAEGQHVHDGRPQSKGSTEAWPWYPKSRKGKQHRRRDINWPGELKTYEDYKKGRCLKIDYTKGDDGAWKVDFDEVIDDMTKLRKIYGEVPRACLVQTRDRQNMQAGGLSRTRTSLNQPPNEQVVGEEWEELPAAKDGEEKKGGLGRRPENVALRIFHIQNWTMAARYMTKIFRIYDEDDISEDRDHPRFLDWLEEKKPRRRAGKPLLTARSWKFTNDNYRGVARCAVGWDVMKRYPCSEGTEDHPQKVMDLKGYDAEDNPIHYHTIFTQRTSMYVQYRLSEASGPGGAYMSGELPGHFDNGHTIIIIDNSKSRSSKDTILAARGEFESKWRRLPTEIPVPRDIELDESGIVDNYMHLITQDVFKSVAQCWDKVIDGAWEHVSILEDKIYAKPEDDSQAKYLWDDQKKWLEFSKLLSYHDDVVRETKKNLADLDGDREDLGQWIPDGLDDIERVSKMISEDLTLRTNNLSDLLYKSVGIRDSRDSLRLGESMWRLSWVTFVFLPANFLVAFFGMNVDTFEENPSIKWFFVSVLPLIVFVFVMWYLLKWVFERKKHDPSQRTGIYEDFFDELHETRSDLWSRHGPEQNVIPVDLKSRVRWYLMQKWSRPPQAPEESIDNDKDIGMGLRWKRKQIRAWTPKIRFRVEKVSDRSSSEDVDLEGVTVHAASSRRVTFSEQAQPDHGRQTGFDGQRTGSEQGSITSIKFGEPEGLNGVGEAKDSGGQVRQVEVPTPETQHSTKNPSSRVHTIG